MSRIFTIPEIEAILERRIILETVVRKYGDEIKKLVDSNLELLKKLSDEEKRLLVDIALWKAIRGEEFWVIDEIKRILKSKGD